MKTTRIPQSLWRASCSVVAASVLLLTSCAKEEVQDLGPKAAPSKSNAVVPTPAYVELPGRAVEVTVGDFGNTYVLGTAQEPGGNGYELYVFRNPSRSFSTPVLWDKFPSQGGVSIATGDNDYPILVDNQGAIKFFDGAGWQTFNPPGTPRASSIAVRNVWLSTCCGGGGALYILGTTPISGGYPVYKYDFTAGVWNQVGTQGAVQLTVDPYTRPWIVSNTGNIFRAGAGGVNAWSSFQGLAMDISYTGSFGNPAMVVLGAPFTTETGNVYWQPYETTPAQYNWQQIGGYGRRIASNGYELWVLTADYRIFRSPIE